MNKGLIFSIIVIVLTSVSCGQRQDNAFEQRPFPQVSVPSMMTDGQEVASFLAEYFWDEFTDTEKAVLRIVQKNLPDSLTPYADIAEAAGMTEAEVLELLSGLKESGAIRRFGASIKHQRTGWTHNAMVAWIVSPEDVDEAGRKAAEHPRISHCYYRPSPYPAWPYTFYTMIHGKSEQDCLDVVDELRRTTSLETCEVLESLKELKKISMTYFAEPAK